ncbi:MAG: VWA domain-containing protein [Anaerolineae bacterium]|nr:VWA domain-containing protein [Anaerolineae bacterium]
MRHHFITGRKGLFTTIILLIWLAGCAQISSGSSDTGPADESSGPAGPASNAVEISIIYAPEEELYMVDAIEQFNRAYAEGRNPLTGQRLESGERPIFVTGEPGSSGQVAQGIINAFIAPNNANVAQPTIFSPSVSHWLALVNFQSGRQVFDVANSPPTALAPVVMAIWESRLQAIQAQNGGQPVGWEELLQVLNSPNGWVDYNVGDRATVYYGHTDPFISSTALSTLIAEFYASARATGGNQDLRRLTLDEVNDPAVQQGVRDIEALIRHYSARTTEFKEYIAQGPDYLDFVALEENDLIFINQGKTIFQPPEKLVALYPKEGTFWHEHPFAVPNAPWVSDEQRAAAKVFTDFIRSEEIQLKVMENGFRPANPSVTVGFPISPEFGVDPNQPSRILEVPDPEVIAAVQASWQLVKKQADVLLVLDTSGSMEGDKITQAIAAANTFLDNMPPQNRVGLVSFDDDVELLVEPAPFEGNQAALRRAINGLTTEGNTALYDGIQQAIDILQSSAENEADRIQSIVLLSDGQDTNSQVSLQQISQLLQTGREARNPIIVIPIAYGSDADIHALNTIARSSATRIQSSDPEDIQRVLELISSYF